MDIPTQLFAKSKVKRDKVLYVILLCAALLSPTVISDMAVARDPAGISFGAWVKDLRKEALQKGIKPALFDRTFKGMTVNYKLPRVRTHKTWARLLARAHARKNKPVKSVFKDGLPLSCHRASQPEFLFPTRYFPQSHINALARRGRDLKNRYAKTFSRIEKTYGVDIDIVLAIWGRETAFGRAKNQFDGMRTWASVAYAGEPKRRENARHELLAALKMVQNGHVSRQEFKTSFSGATGYPQFEPLIFEKFAVDFDGDGRKNIWSSVPDAVASAARYIKSLGWKTGIPWGVEFAPQRGFDCTLEAPRHHLTIQEWQRRGAKLLQQRKFKGEKARLIAAAGTKGPMFLVSSNFEVFRRYNKADYYALFVGHLADKIGCGTRVKGCEFQRRWPLKDPFGFSVKHVCQLQLNLIHAGVTKAGADGLYGGQTRADVGRLQKKKRRPLTCFPTKYMLR